MPAIQNSILLDNKNQRLAVSEAKNVQLRKSIESVSGAKFGPKTSNDLTDEN